VQVFLSHSSADKPTVRKIAAGLEKLGLEVWLDESRIRVGESIPEAVAGALDDSDLLLLAFSGPALASRWVSRELNVFFMQSMRAEKPILPCKLDDSAPPRLLADLKYADFCTSFEKGMAALVGAVGIAEEVSERRAADEISRRLEAKTCFGAHTRSGRAGRAVGGPRQASGASPSNT
jgi:hypothetical protein